MLVIEVSNLLVRNVAGDVELCLGMTDWEGQPLSYFLGEELAAIAVELATSGGGGFAGQFMSTRGETLDVAAHSSGSHLIIELEPAATEGLSAARVMDRITAAAAALGRASSLGDVCSQAAAKFRRLTGFGWVMVYWQAI